MSIWGLVEMEIRLRREQPGDYRAVEELIRKAFWLHNPVCDEPLIAHRLRDAPAFVPELDYVAEAEGRIVGSVMFTRAKIVEAGGGEHEVLSFGPLGVLPAYQNRGVGRALMRRTIAEAKQLGYRAIVFFGEPDYYPRLGFRRAAEFGLAPAEGAPCDAFMAMPLYPGALDGISGRFHEAPYFQVDPGEAEAFNRALSPQEKQPLPSIDVLLRRLSGLARAAVEQRRIPTLAELRRFSGREVAAWPGMDRQAFAIINEVMQAHGYGKKVFPA